MPIQDFKLDNGLQVTGSAKFASSVSSSVGFTGSLLGTSSYGQNANLLDGYDSSDFALTASTNYFKADQIVSGSLTVTASLTASNITGATARLNYVDFAEQSPDYSSGRLHYDSDVGDLTFDTSVEEIRLSLGQQIILKAINSTGVTLTKDTVVRISGQLGGRPTIVTASWENDDNSANTLGLVMSDIAHEADGYVILQGLLRNVNTEKYNVSAGSELYLSSSGEITGGVPPTPYHEVRLGQVISSHASAGSIFVRIQNGYELEELHNLDIVSVQNGDLLRYRSSDGQWINSKVLTGSYELTGGLNVSGNLSASTITGTFSGLMNGVATVAAGTNLTSSLAGGSLVLNLTSSITSGLDNISGSNLSITALTVSGTTAQLASITGSTLSYTTLNTTQMTSSGKIVVDSNVTIGNGKNRTATDIGIGVGALNSTDINTNYNTAIGAYALTNNTSGTQNTAIGFQSLISNVGGTQNVAVGVNALYNNSSGAPNIAIGVGAGLSNTTQGNNIFIGSSAGYNSQASYNVSIGDFAGRYLVSNQNVSIGFYALNSHKGTTGNNFALGALSLQTLISGGENIGIGVNAMQGVINGDGNLAIGSRAISPSLTYGPAGSTVTASYNTAIGYNSLGLMLSGTENLSIGYQSTLNLNTGSQNSAIGTNVLTSLRTGSANTVIGSRALSALQTGSANVVIGNLAGISIITGSGNVIVGSAVGTNNVNNNIYIADGAGNLRLQVNSNGVLDVKSGQIKFPASQNASSDANTLDDYEEGSWTPYITGSGGSTGITYSTSPVQGNFGTYIKIGSSVVALGHIKLTSTGSANGSITIGNLPYAPLFLPLGPHYYSVTLHQYTNFSSSVTSIPYGNIASNATNIALYANGAGGGSTLQISDLSDTAEFSFIATYVATT